MVTKKAKDNNVKHGVQPAVNVTDNDSSICVIAKLPGAREETIRIDIERSSLIISASGNGKQYKKEVSLPSPVRFSNKRFRNGILELYFEKTSPG